MTNFKTTIFLFLLFMCPVISEAQSLNQITGVLVRLQYSPNDHNGHGVWHPRSPEDIPTLSVYGHDLYLYEEHNGYTLYVRDEDETIIYETEIPVGTYYVCLPSSLAGLYEIVLETDDSLFSGYIELE